MKPRDDFRNGDGAACACAEEAAADSDSSGGSDSSGEAEVWVEDRAGPARALAALNALRKSRQHYDVVLVAGEGGAEVAAHRALLAAASPYLLAALGSPAAAPPAPPASPPRDAAPVLRVPGVHADALRDLVDFVYTGRLCARDAAAARRLYLAAWRLRLEAARGALAERLVRRLAPADCLDTRALPDLEPHLLDQLDKYIADHFDEVCGGGAMSALPLVRVELVRASSADGGAEAPLAVAGAALRWLQDHADPDAMEEVCSRTHLVFVDAAGSLRDCGELPAARGGDAPELREYRRAAAARGGRAAAPRPPPPRALPGLELGARSPRPRAGVVAARGGGGRVTRALLELGGRLAAARVAWRDAGAVAVGGALLGARAGPPRRAALALGRCAHGSAALGGALLVCGGYDRARVLRAAERYDPAANAWRALPDMRTARARFPAARLRQAVYVCGGSDGHAELDSVDKYEEDETGQGTWSRCARLPVAASHAAAAGWEGGGALYVVGGWAAGRSLRAVHRYRPGGDEWSDAPPLHTGRSQCASVVWAGALWALGGCDAWHCLASTERLALGGGGEGAAWEAGPALPTARRSMGGAEWRGRLWAVGGSDGAASLRRAEWLAAAGGAWRAGPDLRRPRAALTAGVLQDALYAVAGFDGKEFLSSVECLYEPEGEWTELCCPPAPLALPAQGGANDAPPSKEDVNDIAPKEGKDSTATPGEKNSAAASREEERPAAVRGGEDSAAAPGKGPDAAAPREAPPDAAPREGPPDSAPPLENGTASPLQ